ncbi:MAG: Na+/H+ antiporter subunit E [Lachnospiraceae bacterium]|nr:Na+/H+ antiporter subunit E [Lachnospiraceae bacterium]
MYILIFTIWLILNDHYTVEVCLLGLALTILLGGLLYVLFGYTVKKDLRILRKVPLFAGYLAVLFVEIIKANVKVLSCILNWRHPLSPTIVVFHSGLRTSFGRFVLANSITLTPGTITVEVDDEKDLLTVHCIRRELLDISEDALFIRLIRRLEA